MRKDKFHSLLIRECKGSGGRRKPDILRFKKIIGRHCAINHTQVSRADVFEFISQLYNHYIVGTRAFDLGRLLCRISNDFQSDYNPVNFQEEDPQDPNNIILGRLIVEIQHQPISLFPDLIPQGWYRKLYKNETVQ